MKEKQENKFSCQCDLDKKGCNFCSKRDFEEFRRRTRDEGVLFNRTTQGSNRPSDHNINNIEERRDVPVGTIESQ